MKDTKSKSKATIFGETFKELCYFMTILFCALRACGMIQWEWYWVMSPIFLSMAVGLLLIIITGVLITFLVNKEDK